MHTPNLTPFQYSYVEKCGFLTRGVNDCWKRSRSQKSIFTQTNGVGTSVRNFKGKGSTVAKICCLVQRAIFIVIKLEPHKPDFAGHCPIYIIIIIISIILVYCKQIKL